MLEGMLWTRIFRAAKPKHIKQDLPNNGQILNKRRRKDIKEGLYTKVIATLLLTHITTMTCATTSSSSSKNNIFFLKDLFPNSSARSQCRKLTENVSGTEVLEIDKFTGRAGPVRACGWRDEGRQTSPQAGRS